MDRRANSLVFGVPTMLALSACGGGGGAPVQAPAMPQTGGNAQLQPMSKTAALPSLSLSPQFNERGNIVIADQFNNRVIEIDPPSHRIVWSFGGPSSAGPDTIVGTNDAERVGRFTLMAGTGVPAPPPLFEPKNCPNGCIDNRVILVNPRGKIVWQYGQFGVTGSGFNQLNTPVQNTFLPNRHVLITDQGNERVIEVNHSKQITWQYGTTGKIGSGENQLSNPNSAELLENGHILIADENNNRVIEVTRAKQIVWQSPNQVDGKQISGAAFASRLDNGNTLITDSNNNRIVEIDEDKNVVWDYSTMDPSGNTNPLPTRAVRLRNGDTLISDQFNDRVIQVRKTGLRTGTIVFTQGQLKVAGNGNDQLNAPYDAKVVGDYTGLTPPFDNDNDRDDSDPTRD